MARLHQDGSALDPLILRRGLLWLGVLASLSIGLIVLDQTHRLQPAENAAARAFTPLQAVLTQKTDALSGFWSTISQITQLREENDRLRQEVADLRLQNTQLSRAEAENETMRAQLKYAQANPLFTLMPASVLGKDLHGLDDYIEIDRGATDGLQPQMTVVSPDGYLVGRILNLTEHRARVLIITNPSSSVAAMVADKDGQAEDVVDGHVHGRLQMGNIPQTVKIKIGDDVYTSGLGGNFPKGIKIGQIATLNNGDVELFQQAEVAPYVDFGRLPAVEVVTNNLPPK
jgi:rod shape-determining protein MreC